MGAKLRVFVSSTIKDLANERDAVVRKIREIDFEPVNAEGWLPNGNKSWSIIQEEIDSSDFFVLILGERYGWIPKEGSGATSNLSVTHLELESARKLGLPILTFIKTLSYESDRDSEDAKRRDAFRKEVADWSSGLFIAEFDLAYDLAAKVGAAIVGLLADSYKRSLVLKRAVITRSYKDRLLLANSVPISIPERLVKDINNEKVVLIAGPGVSLAAGYPSERALAEFLLSQLSGVDNLSETPLSWIPFPVIAGLYDAHSNRDSLINTLEQVISGFPDVRPTQIHMHGARLFKTIFTTNIDDLFEIAYHNQNLPFQVIEPSRKSLEGGFPTLEEIRSISDISTDNILVKLNGTITNHNSLLLTDRERSNSFDQAMSIRYFMAQSLDASTALIIDPAPLNPYFNWILQLEQSQRDSHGYFEERISHSYIIVPPGNSVYHNRYGRAGTVIEANPDDFFRSLVNELENKGN